MFGCDCFYWSTPWSNSYNIGSESESESEPEPFSLPAPLPRWPSGGGFATGIINLGELDVSIITSFESVWTCSPIRGKEKGVTFYKPVEISDGFHSLGHYCQTDSQPLRGFVLVAQDRGISDLPALAKPIDYTLVWDLDTQQKGRVCIWLPCSPKGYKALGFVTTDEPTKPSLDEIRCVRADLVEKCEACDLLLDIDFSTSSSPFQIWCTRPWKRGMLGKGVPVGTFFCCTDPISCDDKVSTGCLKNLDSTLHAMPNLDQAHALIKHYGPTVFFHPEEIYLPSSVPWFFDNGALLYRNGKGYAERIDSRGSNLPHGGFNDGKYWIDLPDDEDKRNHLKYGNLESAKLYVHLKPALGGTSTDIVMWVFCPFNGPATLKVGLANVALGKVGEHVGDWEHFTLRVCNFTGKLQSVYFSQHSGGEWVDACDLEFIEGNKPVVYSSKDGHASFPHPGTYIWGPSRLKMGVRNDAARSKHLVDSSIKYQIVAAEYLGDDVEELPWLQFMREWGPTIVYGSRSEIEKIINHLPVFVRFSVENLIDLFPTELYGEEGPTGPKEKDNWLGDERW
ncbi:hypothetical protein V2J09_019801 [Rumex salicifolius]